MDRILVVEDSPTQAQGLAEVLTSRGFEVLLAATGQEALTLARSTHPDLLLLDLYLPDLSGEMVFRQLRQEEETSRIPVVVVTSSEEREDRLRLLELGADDYLLKPVEPLELVARVRTLLRAKRLSDRLLLSFLELDRMGRFAESFAAEGVADWTALKVADEMARELLGEQPGLADHPQYTWAASRVGARLLATAWYWRQGSWYRKQRVYRAMDVSRALSPYARGEGRYIGKQPMEASLAAFLGFPTDPPPQNFVAASGPSGFLLLAGYPWEVGVWEFPILRAAFRLWGVFERLRLEARRQELAFFSALEALALAAEFYDRDTADHVQRVALLARETARALGCPPRFVRWMGPSARVHDVGKMSVPLELVMKSGPLTAEEEQLLRQHTVNGAKLLGNLPQLEMARNIALYHHENYDGTGYPRGLAGDAIPLEARIVRVVDVYDALRSLRTYKPAYTHEEAVAALRKGDSRINPSCFDPRVLEAFLTTVPRYLHLYGR
jgi:response regulator RpfG family c-di-GMP phosphodiesterase